MMQQHTIHIAGGVVRNPLVRLTEPVTLDFLAGEHIAIVGPNGAGKSLLVDMLTGKYPLRDGELTYDFSPSLTKTAYDNIKYIAFRDTYGSADANYYYQQRWNAHDQEAMRSLDFTLQLNNIRCPVTILCGKKDTANLKPFLLIP